MRKKIVYTKHARMRMQQYNISELEIVNTIYNPDKILPGYRNRKIAQKVLNRYLLRVIYEENDLITIITVYYARRERYE
mgnify:CR=1 FL=1